MVFTHIPSNVLLAAVALMPSLGWAVAVLLARFALSQMDVPARQAFVAAIVEPSERTAAAAYTNTARYVGRPAGPAIGGASCKAPRSPRRFWPPAPSSSDMTSCSMGHSAVQHKGTGELGERRVQPSR